MSGFHGPKCQEMRFPAFQFSKIFRRHMPPDPPRNDGLKPIVRVLRTHNRLLFTNLRLLKNLYTTLKWESWSVLGEDRASNKNLLINFQVHKSILTITGIKGFKIYSIWKINPWVHYYFSDQLSWVVPAENYPLMTLREHLNRKDQELQV